MSEFYSLIIKQNVTFLGLVTISLNISALLSRVVIKISKTTSIIPSFDCNCESNVNTALDKKSLTFLNQGLEKKILEM